MVVRALDASAYTGQISPSVWPQLKAAGIEVFIPQIYGGGPGGTGPNPQLTNHVRGAIAGGLKVFSGYTWPPYKWEDAAVYWRSHLPDVPLGVMWLDVEAGAGVQHAHERGLASVGIPAGVYASRHTWQVEMDNDLTFGHLPLWVAYYAPGPWPTVLPKSPSILPVGWNPEQVKAWQWLGTTTLRDEQFDLNVVSESLIPQEEDMDATQDQRLKNVEQGIKSISAMMQGGNLSISLIKTADKPEWYALYLTEASVWVRRHVPDPRTAILMGLDGPPRIVTIAEMASIKEGPKIPSLKV